MNRNRKKLLYVFILPVLILFISWMSLPYYLSRALIYQKPGIEDLSIFPYRKVEAGSPIPWAIHSNYNRFRLPDSLRNDIESYNTTALLVACHNSILHEEYWDGYSDSSLTNSFSMAKSIVSVLIGCLWDEGKIRDLDQPVTDFLSPTGEQRMKNLRIRDLLTMSSGLDWDESYSAAFSVTTQAYYGKDLPGLVLSLGMAEPPGKIFRYRSCDSQLLGLIIEKASGMTLSEYASQKLWQPLGAAYPAVWSLDQRDGTEKSFCCFYSNARDFARFGQMVLDSGAFMGKQIVSREYLRQATSSASHLKDKDGKTCNWYGYQFWKLHHKGIDCLLARGILGQYIFIVPAKDMVIVRLGHKRSEAFRDKIPLDVFTYLEAGIILSGNL